MAATAPLALLFPNQGAPRAKAPTHKATRHASVTIKRVATVSKRAKCQTETDNQPPGGSGQAVPPCGEGAADGGGSDSFFVNDARDRGGARAAGGEDQRDTMRELVDLFKQAFAISTHDQGHRAHSGTSSNEILELRQREKIDVPAWSDDYLKNRSIEVALRVFTSAFEAWLESEGLAGVMRSSEVPVGAAGVDLNWLSSTFGEERVKQSRKIWTFMLAKITAQPVQAQILASESPQAGYRVFLEQYSQDKSQERQTLDDAWNVIGQRQAESLMDYYGRAVALWMRLRSYGDNRDEKSMCRHIVRGFLPRFEKSKDRLLFDSMLSRGYDAGDAEVGRARAEVRAESWRGEERDGHALVVAGVGRGGGAGKPAAAGSEQGGHRLQQPKGSVQPHQQQPSHFCQLHGPNSTHETSKCHKLRHEFLAHYNEFCAYMNGRRETQGSVFPRGGAQDSGRMVGGPSRQQLYQNEQGAGWSHSPALPGPPRGPGSGAGGQLHGRSSWGRGYGGYGPSPPESRGRQVGGRGGGDITSGWEATSAPGSTPSWTSPPPEAGYGYGLAAHGVDHGGGPYGSAAGGGYGFHQLPDGGWLYQQQEVSNLPHYPSAAGPDAQQPRAYEAFDTPQQHQQQQHHGAPQATSSSSSHSPAPGDALPPAGDSTLRLFMARGVCPRGKSEADSGASAMISNKVDAIYNVRHLGPDEQFIQIGDLAFIKVAAVGSLDLRFHQIGADGKQEDLDYTVPEFLFVLGCGFNLFSVWKVSHKHEHVITLTGTMDSCRWCLPARGTRAPVPKQGGGYRGKRAPNDVFHIDLCGAYTATIGGNHYMLFGVDAATGWMTCYAMRFRSEALAGVKRMVVDAAQKAGTAIKCIRCDCDALWTSSDFKGFCASMGIALEYAPPGVQQYNGVVESAIQRCLKVGGQGIPPGRPGAAWPPRIFSCPRAECSWR
ncbi:unnamed protein product [Ectocarpus sp. CCAP 1310/34]|nr:unnamed protein product [Ectocarpus sp. CCAP 1310/34]